MNKEGEENQKCKLQFSVYQFHCAVKLGFRATRCVPTAASRYNAHTMAADDVTYRSAISRSADKESDSTHSAPTPASQRWQHNRVCPQLARSLYLEAARGKWLGDH